MAKPMVCCSCCWPPDRRPRRSKAGRNQPMQKDSEPIHLRYLLAVPRVVGLCIQFVVLGRVLRFPFAGSGGLVGQTADD